MNTGNTRHIANTLTKMLPLIAVIISSVYLIGICICIYFSGYFRDEYVPAVVEIPEIITYGMWILFVALIISIAAIITSKTTASKKAKKVCAVYWLVLIMLTSLFFLYAYRMQKLYPITVSNEICTNLNLRFHKAPLDHTGIGMVNKDTANHIKGGSDQ